MQWQTLYLAISTSSVTDGMRYSIKLITYLPNLPISWLNQFKPIYKSEFKLKSEG